MTHTKQDNSKSKLTKREAQELLLFMVRNGGYWMTGTKQDNQTVLCEECGWSHQDDWYQSHNWDQEFHQLETLEVVVRTDRRYDCQFSID